MSHCYRNALWLLLATINRVEITSRVLAIPSFLKHGRYQCIPVYAFKYP